MAAIRVSTMTSVPETPSPSKISWTRILGLRDGVYLITNIALAQTRDVQPKGSPSYSRLQRDCDDKYVVTAIRWASGAPTRKRHAKPARQKSRPLLGHIGVG